MHTISTRCVAAVIHFLLAVGSSVARRTGTAVAVVLLCAGPAVKAWGISTPHGAVLAVLPGESLRAATRVAINHVLKKKINRFAVSSMSKCIPINKALGLLLVYWLG